ncbi:hypothetical protein [Streptacidiphilus jiangxiensis]|uniref:Uncharacterized protein n=1 Tax=Streptacidiphilus jiangxiensis TaxID=235985 RepID=A0A1H7JPX1_STRJI|nr:hypothetical protein [Streptacidiphilus jiangxiensis]SEK76572.1 hypothetical protein SAMN05414137_103401 [Streptacidiphilus jiangxiensis]
MEYDMSPKTQSGMRLTACVVLLVGTAFLVVAVVLHHVWTTLLFSLVFALGLAVAVTLFGRANRQSRS